MLIMSAMGVMMGIVTTAWPEPEGMKKLMMQLASTMSQPEAIVPTL